MPIPNVTRLRCAIVAEAHTWLNTSYQHQGRVKGNAAFKGGVDCAGLIIAVGNTLRLWPLEHFDYHDYGQDVAEDFLLSQFDHHMIRKSKPCGGDIVVLRIGGKIQHAGIITFEHDLIHACSRAGKVIESILNHKLWKHVAAMYQYPLLSERISSR